MAVDPQHRRKLLKGDPQPLEEAWLLSLEDAQLDLDFYHQAARALIGAGRTDSLKSLLELLDEQLVARGELGGRLEVLRRWGDRIIGGSKLHSEILKTLRSRHGSHSLYDDLEEWIGLQRAKDDIPKTWEKVDRLESVIGFDVGSVVLLHGKGAGRVVEVNLALKSFKVDLVGVAATITVGFAGAKKLLVALEEGHFLRTKVEQPETLERLRDQQPSELLRLVLMSSEGPLTAQEIRDAVSGIVPPARWTSWWNAARKHPQVVTLPGGRQQYTWVADADAATSTIRRRFERAGTRERLDLMRGQDAGELREEMIATLATEATKLAARQPAQAFEIAVSLARSGADPTGQPWAPSALLAAADPVELLGKIEDRASREYAYQVLAQRPDGAEIAAQRALAEDEPKLIDQLMTLLSAEQVAQVEQQAMVQPHRSPGLFVRLAERAADDEEIRARNPAKLLQQILASLGNDRFATHRRRLEALVEAGSTVPRLLPLLEEEQARAAEESIQRAYGLADYQREPLLNALYLRFPSLRRQAEAPLYATEASIEDKKRELREMLEVDIPANRKAIQEAREMGDLRENFEYKSARQRHEYLSARAAQLDRDLRRVQPIQLGEGAVDTVRIGTVVELSGATEATYTILGPWESDPEKGVLSNESELAGKLLGRRVGDEVAEVGRIAAIRPAS